MALHLDAGRYAAFLWPAYGISALALIGMTVQSLWSARRWRRRAREAERDKPDRRR